MRNSEMLSLIIIVLISIMICILFFFDTNFILKKFFLSLVMFFTIPSGFMIYENLKNKLNIKGNFLKIDILYYFLVFLGGGWCFLFLFGYIESYEDFSILKYFILIFYLFIYLFIFIVKILKG